MQIHPPIVLGHVRAPIRRAFPVVRLAVGVRSAVAWSVATVPPSIWMTALAVDARSTPKLDWMSYRRGAEAILAGSSPYASFQLAGPYELTAAAAGAGFVYPPSGAVVLAPLTSSLEWWLAISVFVWIAGHLRLLRVQVPSAAISAAILWFVALTRPFRDGLDSGAASVLIAGLLALTLAGERTSLAVGLAAATKLFPSAWLAWGVRDSSRRMLIPALIGLSIPIAASIALAGLGPWREWLTIVANAEPSCNSVSLRCLGVPAWAAYGAAATLLLVSLKAPRPLAALAMGSIVLVAAPDWHSHYNLLLVPPVVVAASGLWQERRRRRSAHQAQLAADDTSRRRTDLAPVS